LTYKRQYGEYIEKYTALLTQWMEKRDTVDAELRRARAETATSLRHDMKRVHQLQVLEKKRDKCIRVTSELLQTLRDTRQQKETLTLSIDNILFDNIVMIDQTLRNFRDLQALETSLTSNS
jgi:uncharacterized coiled-coil DUF342 family protein